MAQKPKLQPVKIRVDRIRLVEDDNSGGGGVGGVGGGISKCRSFPRFHHVAEQGGGVGGGVSGGVSGGGGQLDVPFKHLASGLSFGGSVSSVGSLGVSGGGGGGAMSSTGSLEVHAPSVHAIDSPTSASQQLLWCRRSESCPSLWLSFQRQVQAAASAMADSSVSRSVRASPLPPPRCPQQNLQQATPATPVAAEAAAAAAALVADAQTESRQPDEEDGGLRRFTGGSALNRQTRRSRRKCEEWIVKLGN